MQTINVRTTQNVFIEYPLASLGDRILAYLIDTVIVIAYVILVVIILIQADVNSIALVIAVISIPVTLYHILFEIFMDGQSPGKRQMNIKVVRIDGTPPTLGNYIIRWLLRFIDINLLSGGVAVLAIGIGGKGQRLGDMAAGTTVIKILPPQTTNAQQIFTTAEENYIPVFPQVMQLNDQDIELIQQALNVNRDSGNNIPVAAVAEKIQTVLGIRTDMPPVKFLYTIVKDYSHLTSQS